MIKNVLLDLDGTLLKMDNKAFIDYYFKLLCKKMAGYGYVPEELVKAIWLATMEVLKNDGTMTNRERFFLNFNELMKDKLHDTPEKVEKTFDAFYEKEFDEAKVMVKTDGESHDFVKYLKDKGYNVIIATSPVFPLVAVKRRLSWIGFDEKDFCLVTTYENSCHSKPNPEYYKDILKGLDLNKDECLMVGNDLNDDIYPAKSVGIKTFYLDTYPIGDDEDYKGPRGNFKDLKAFLENYDH